MLHRYCIFSVVRCFVLMQRGPRIAPSLHFVKSLGDGLSITERCAVTDIPLALCGPFLLVYWLLYMSITSMLPLRWWCHMSLRHFCWGAVVSRKGGLDSVQVHQTVPYIFISLNSLANVTLLSHPQCRQKTWTRTLRWTTRTKNRWVSDCCLDVVG